MNKQEIINLLERICKQMSDIENFAWSYRCPIDIDDTLWQDAKLALERLIDTPSGN